MVTKERIRRKKHINTTIHFNELYRQLNEQQKLAVDTIEGPIMVLAGPGTGKTQTLAMRIAKILKETQMDPWNILCLTFTESGVAAMRERLVSIIGTSAYYVRIHTFHSFCNEIIQENPDTFAFTRSFTPLADVERIRLLRSLIDNLPGTSKLKPFGAPYVFLKDIASNIRSLKQEDISPKKFQAIAASIESFVKSEQDAAQRFFSLKPKERTSATCNGVHKRLKTAAKKSKIPEGMIQHLDDMFSKAELEESTQRTAYKNELKRWFDRLARNAPKQRDLALLYKEYERRLSKSGHYDFEDMIILVVQQLQKDENLLAHYQEQFQYILVDEYQDTNGAQNEVVQLLGSFDDSPNIFVVGDDKQSIYRFQGASMTNMLEFYETYKSSIQVISLQENYRSKQRILDAADQLITHNEELLARHIPGVSNVLTATRGEGTPLTLHEYPSEGAEDYGVAQHIQHLITTGAAPQDIAVLYRYNRDGARLLQHLTSIGVPARLEAGENVLRDRYVRQFLKVIAYIAGRGLDDTLADILRFDWWDSNPLDVLKVTQWAGRHRITLVEMLSSSKKMKEAGAADPDALHAIIHRLATWHAFSANATLHHVLTKVLEESGLLDVLMYSSGGLPSLHCISILLEEAKRQNETDHNISLEAFLRSLALLQEHDVPLVANPWHAGDNAVRLMTAHRAKGLEFRHVFIVRLNDKHWGNVPEPSRITLPQGLVRHRHAGAHERNEDERRLLYVALTRAKDEAMLTRAKQSTSGREQTPSLFIHELPQDILVSVQHKESGGQAAQRLVQNVLKPSPAITDDVREWLQEILQRYVMSVTHLNNYLACPHSFYIKNVLKVPSVKTPYQSLGTAIHAALAEGHLNKQHMLAIFDRTLKREILTKQELRDTREVGLAYLRGWYDHYKHEPIYDTLHEYNFTSHGVTMNDVPITGTIDKIEILDKEAKTVNVVDYKTGNPDRSMQKLKPGEDYHRQLVFYKLLCDASPRFEYDMISGEVDFIQPSEKRGYIKKKLEISGKETEELAGTIARVWKEIQDLKFLEESSHCGKCDSCLALQD